MLSKKHYIEIAKIIKRIKNKPFMYDADGVISLFQEELIDYFKRDNPNFDENRFITAIQGK